MLFSHFPSDCRYLRSAVGMKVVLLTRRTFKSAFKRRVLRRASTQWTTISSHHLNRVEHARTTCSLENLLTRQRVAFYSTENDNTTKNQKRAPHEETPKPFPLDQEFLELLQKIPLEKLEKHGVPKEMEEKFGKERVERLLKHFLKVQNQAAHKATKELFLENLEEANKQEEKEEQKLEEALKPPEEPPKSKQDPSNKVVMWLALLVVLVIAFKHSMERRKAAINNTFPEDRVYSPEQVAWMQKIPTRALSRAWGAVMSLEAPTPIQTVLNRAFAFVFGCNVGEAEKDISEYKSLQAFFERNLKEGIRPIDQNALLASPVDGTVVHYGFVDEDHGLIEQVKGVTYKLSDFMGEDSPIYQHFKKVKGRSNKDLYYCVIYLAPYNYHGYHSPVDWKIDTRRHFPGHLFPVSKWSVNFIKGVFGFNERVVLTGTWKHGFFSYVPVGAYNVGSMRLGFDKDLKTNRPDQTATSPFEEKKYPEAVEMKKGENIGFFNFGSTVVLVFEAPKLLFMVPPGGKVKLGELLCVEMTKELAEEHEARLARRAAIINEQIKTQLEAQIAEIEKAEERQRAIERIRQKREEAAEEKARRVNKEEIPEKYREQSEKKRQYIEAAERRKSD